MPLNDEPNPNTKRAGGWVELLIILILVSAAFLFVVFAGDFLVVNDKPVPSDAIIVLGGGSLERVAKGVQLYDAGYAKYLIFSGGNHYTPGYTEADYMAYQAEQAGVGSRDLLLERKSTTTYQNALYTKQIMQAHHWQSAIVVSSDYHMRRVQLMFHRVYRGSGIRLVYVAAPDHDFSPGRWWRNRDSLAITLSEYEKLAAALVGIQ